MKKWKIGLLCFCSCLGAFLAGTICSGQKTLRQAGGGAVENESDADREVLKVALTFDDGPHSVCTPKLLDGLKERGVSATFFVLGRNIQGNEELLLRMKEEGHLIGNHTFSHKDLTELSRERAEQEVIRTGNAIYEATGVYTAFVRPPFGRWPENLEFRVTMIPVLWTVDSRDWELRDAGAVEEYVLSRTEPGDVILMHDCYETSVEAALFIVDRLREQGYSFVTVDELILP